MSHDAKTRETESPTSSGPLDVALWPHQYRDVFEIDQYENVYILGGRGSGKSYEDKPRIFRWSDPPFPKDLCIGIFAPTDAQLQTVLGPINDAVEAMGLKTVYAKQAPKKWRRRWRRKGIRVPPQRLRNGKMWIWEDGTHIFATTLVNNAYTRAKSLDFNVILLQEGTEPGVTEAAIDTLIACLRCGAATEQEDGKWRCTVPGHLHQFVLVANVPLNDPSHWIRKKVKKLTAANEARKKKKRPPSFILLQSSTWDNPSTGEGYIEKLAAAWDERTYAEQTSGSLEVNSAVTSYFSFAEENILGYREDGKPILTYGNTRPIHFWFDWNATPAAVGWGHDLRSDEVPPHMLKSGAHYFGIHGELFSGAEPMVTSQVALALLEDPQEGATGACIDCDHAMKEHSIETAKGKVCFTCGYQDKHTGRHCSGLTSAFEGKAGFIHAPANWHGLMKHRGPIYVYGDATGIGTSSQAATNDPGGNIRILRDAFAVLGDRVHFRFPEVNPKVNLRVAAMNRSFKAKNGIRSLYVAEWCRAHIDDFREVIPDPATGKPLKVSKSPSQRRKGDDYWMRTDISDGCGYMVAWRWPAAERSSDLQGGFAHGEDYGPLANNWPRPG